MFCSIAVNRCRGAADVAVPPWEPRKWQNLAFLARHSSSNGVGWMQAMRLHTRRVEARLTDETHKKLLAGAVFADNIRRSFFSRASEKLYVGILGSRRMRKLRSESLRARLKQAERSGNMDEAFRLNAEADGDEANAGEADPEDGTHLLCSAFGCGTLF